MMHGAWRGVIVLLGLVLLAIGLIGTCSVGIINGWWLLAAVGLGLLGWDQWIEHHEQGASR